MELNIQKNWGEYFKWLSYQILQSNLKINVFLGLGRRIRRKEQDGGKKSFYCLKKQNTYN